MSCMATLATRFARRCRSRSSVDRLATSKAAASEDCLRDSVLARQQSALQSPRQESASGWARCHLRLDCFRRPAAVLPNPSCGSIRAGVRKRRFRAPAFRFQFGHGGGFGARVFVRAFGFRADSEPRRRNWRARKDRQPERTPPSGRAAWPAARCSAGWTNMPPRDPRRPDAARPRSAAAEPDCRAMPGKRLLPGPARETRWRSFKRIPTCFRLWKRYPGVSTGIPAARSCLCSRQARG